MAKKKTSDDNVKKIIVRQVASSIGCKPDQIATLKGLGLRKPQSVSVLNDTDAIRGMVNKVKHLVTMVVVS